MTPGTLDTGRSSEHSSVKLGPKSSWERDLPNSGCEGLQEQHSGLDDEAQVRPGLSNARSLRAIFQLLTIGLLKTYREVVSGVPSRLPRCTFGLPPCIGDTGG